MLYPKTSNCEQCASISALLSKIDCKLKELAIKLYNNTVYILNSNIQRDIYWDLLNYKRILTYRSVNSSYVQDYDLDKLASRVIILVNQ